MCASMLVRLVFGDLEASILQQGLKMAVERAIEETHSSRAAPT